MKSNATKKRFPVNPEDWEKLISEAPGAGTPPDESQEQSFWEKAVMVREGGPAAVRSALAEKRRRGLGRRAKKVLLSVRYSPEVVEYFKATGNGWQIRMDEALREWIKTHPSA